MKLFFSLPALSVALSTDMDACTKLSIHEPHPLKRGSPREVVVVTGGAGFLGSYVTEELLDLGYSVRVLDDLKEGSLEWLPLQHPHLEFVHGDPLNLDALSRAMQGADGVMHLYGTDAIAPSLRMPDKTTEALRRNVMATANVLQAAHDARLHKAVYASNAHFYGDHESRLTENITHNPSSPMAASKYMAEQIMHLYTDFFDVRTVGLRLFHLYGDRMPIGGLHCNVLGKFLAQKMENKPLTIQGEGTQLRDFVHVKDAAKSFVMAYQNRIRDPYVNIGTGRGHSIIDLAALISKSTVHVPHRPHDIESLVSDTCLAKKHLHWEATTKLEDWLQEFDPTADVRAPYWKKFETNDYFTRQIPNWPKMTSSERMEKLLEKMAKMPDYLAVGVATIREMSHEEL